MRGVFITLAGIMLAGCAGTPRAPENVALLQGDEWTFPAGQEPERIVPRLFAEAAASQVELKAVVRTENDFHPVTYSLFLETNVIFNSLFPETAPQRGMLPFRETELDQLVTTLEREDLCSAWPGARLQGDFLVYTDGSGYRACVEADGWLDDGTLRKELWAQYKPSSIDWLQTGPKKGEQPVE